jgi:hypothetical protein
MAKEKANITPLSSVKVKKGRVHMHVGKPTPHLYGKGIRATCKWTGPSEADIQERGRDKRGRRP